MELVGFDLLRIMGSADYISGVDVLLLLLSLLIDLLSSKLFLKLLS